MDLFPATTKSLSGLTKTVPQFESESEIRKTANVFES